MIQSNIPSVQRPNTRWPYTYYGTEDAAAVGLCVLGGTDLVHSSSDWTSICWKVLISSRLPRIINTSRLLILQEETQL